MPAALATAAACLFAAVVTYLLVLAPITDVFDDPIHHQPVTAAGKAVMARVGPVQAISLVAVVLLLAISLILPASSRRRVHAVMAAVLGLAAFILTLEVLMVLGWAVTLWPASDATAAELGASRQVMLWPVGWHVQIVTGALLLAAEWMTTVSALRRWVSKSCR